MPAWLETLSVGPVVLFTLVLARVSGLVTSLPIFTGQQIPMQVRAFLTVALALVLTPTQWHAQPPPPVNVAEYVLLTASELLIGLVLGLGILILMTGVQVAGQVISQMSGMSLADVFAPGVDTSMPLFSNLLWMVAMATFVVIGGHRAMIDALLQTYTSLPVGQVCSVGSLAHTSVMLMTESFALGIRVAAPCLIALLLATLVLGLIGRTMPQLNILVLGFGINAMVTFVVLAASIGGAAYLFQDYFDPVLRELLTALHPG